MQHSPDEKLKAEREEIARPRSSPRVITLLIAVFSVSSTPKNKKRGFFLVYQESIRRPPVSTGLCHPPNKSLTLVLSPCSGGELQRMCSSQFSWQQSPGAALDSQRICSDSIWVPQSRIWLLFWVPAVRGTTAREGLCHPFLFPGLCPDFPAFRGVSG